MSLRIVTLSALALGACTVGAGCASQPPVPSEQITKARTLVEQADKSNAQRYAAADLQRAHDELSNADKAVSERKYADARRYAEDAQVDADLASARASSGEAQRAAQEINRGMDSLQQESQRQTGSN
jgi:hypothetical protein